MLKHSLKQTLSRSIIPRKLLISYVTRSIRQVNNLAQLVDTANQEEIQRTAKYLEYTTKVYKPSKRITFNREGELLLFSCDNIRHNQIYLKYPYVLYNSLILLSAYNFFVDPCKKYFK